MSRALLLSLALAAVAAAATASGDARATAACRWDQLRLSVETQGENTTTWIGIELGNGGPACILSGGAATLTIERLGRGALVRGNPLVLPLGGAIGRGGTRLLRADWDNWCGSRRGLSLRVRYGPVVVLSRFTHLPVCLDRSGRSRLQSIPAASPACHLSHFELALGPEISEATGQNTLALRLTNRGSVGCVLDGYPSVTLSDRQGAIPFSIHHGGDQMITPIGPKRVLVRARGTAFVLLNHYRCDLGSVREADRVRLGRPPDVASLALTDPNSRLSYCGSGDPGSVLTVSPFEPTVRDALHG